MLKPEFQQLFENASGNLIVDPATYDQWFDSANEKRRRMAVGAKRYSLVKDTDGAAPSWASFIDPKSGSLLSFKDLEKESVGERSARIAKVQRLIDQRRELLRKAALLLPV